MPGFLSSIVHPAFCFLRCIRLTSHQRFPGPPPATFSISRNQICQRHPQRARYATQQQDGDITFAAF